MFYIRWTIIGLSLMTITFGFKPFLSAIDASSSGDKHIASSSSFLDRLFKRSNERADSVKQAKEEVIDLGEIENIVEETDGEQSVLLNDPSMKLNWGFNDELKATINASRAWQITRGSRDIVVAVIDTGIDVKHPDIQANLWRNPGETPNDGIDNDGNGFIDDVYGWNFVGNNKDLTDNHGHGTHIAGIVGAEGGNGIGISGVAPKVSLMILKYYDPQAKNNNNLNNTIKALHYAIDNGAHIINYSGGGNEFSKEEYEAIAKARDKGILVIAAAGNERANSDHARYYPASYDLDNIISVTAIDPNANVLNSSNFGTNTVHIAAPGQNIFSTLPGGKYGMMTGTSQATSFVSGVAALIMANNRNFDYRQVRRQILSTADRLASLEGKTNTAGKLNSWAALAMQESSTTITGLTTFSQQRFFAGDRNEGELNNIRDLSNLLEVFEDQL